MSAAEYWPRSGGRAFGYARRHCFCFCFAAGSVLITLVAGVVLRRRVLWPMMIAAVVMALGGLGQLNYPGLANFWREIRDLWPYGLIVVALALLLIAPHGKDDGYAPGGLTALRRCADVAELWNGSPTRRSGSRCSRSPVSRSSLGSTTSSSSRSSRANCPRSSRPRHVSSGSLALITRVLLLCDISWLMSLTKVLFTMPILNVGITGKSLILLLGGLFLIGKSVLEVHEKLEGEDGRSTAGGKVASFKAAIVQILLLDVVFSLDSVITAVGMASRLSIMITAVVVALGVMLMFAGAISDFVNRHPTLKVLALRFPDPDRRDLGG